GDDDGQRETGETGTALEQIDEHRQQRRAEEDLDDRLIEFFQELFPQRFARQRRQLVDAELTKTLGGRGGAKAILGDARENLLDFVEGTHVGFFRKNFTAENAESAEKKREKERQSRTERKSVSFFSCRLVSVFSSLRSLRSLR